MKTMKPAAIALAMTAFSAVAIGDNQVQQTVNGTLTVNCATPANPSQTLPYDVSSQVSRVGYNGFNEPMQQCFDLYSWQSFVALNWPADASGNPIGSSIGDDPKAMRVWEHYEGVEEIFDRKLFGKKKADAGIKPIHMMAKNSHVINPTGSFIEASGQPLIDKNLNYVVYEIKVNPEEVNFILTNNLNTKAGQAKAGNIDFPGGSDASQTVGSMEIKAAWRILDPKVDDVSRFYHRDALIYVKAENSATGKARYIPATLGLVGMHIIRKTEAFQWVWSSFEHVDNAPDVNDVTVKPAANNYSFYNPACPIQVCQQNTPPTPVKGKYTWAAQAPYAAAFAFKDSQGKLYGSQIVRTTPVPAYTEQLNAIWRGALKGTVWENYRLIGSQWFAHSDGGVPPQQFPVPQAEANTTLESYDQSQFSCISCHINAETTANKSADFSFILGLAK